MRTAACRLGASLGLAARGGCFLVFAATPLLSQAYRGSVKLPPMRPEDFDYRLPPEQIAQRPLPRRDGSRMLLLERSARRPEDLAFAQFPDLLQGHELLVLNNVRVVPARLFGQRTGTLPATAAPSRRNQQPTGEIEIFLTRQREPDTWEALVRPGRKMQIGERVFFGERELSAEVLARGERGLRTLQFTTHDAQSISEHLERLGHVPLPPYIERPDELADRERYQTVFAKYPGAIAAPTAGLHFTSEILQKVQQKGIEICELTLHVGLGTFQPIHSETLEKHAMHSEVYEIPEDTALQIAAARNSGRPIVAIGTTVVRALEASALAAAEVKSSQLLVAGKAEATLFIMPGFQFRVVDALLTNFHLPKSTLLALVSAFAGRERILAAYRHAVQAGYRFYSYGDCMFLR